MLFNDAANLSVCSIGYG